VVRVVFYEVVQKRKNMRHVNGSKLQRIIEFMTHQLADILAGLSESVGLNKRNDRRCHGKEKQITHTQ